MGDVHDQRMARRATLDREDPTHRVRVEGPGPEAVDRLGRHGHEPTGHEQLGRRLDVGGGHGSGGPRADRALGDDDEHAGRGPERDGVVAGGPVGQRLQDSGEGSGPGRAGQHPVGRPASLRPRSPGHRRRSTTASNASDTTGHASADGRPRASPSITVMPVAGSVIRSDAAIDADQHAADVGSAPRSQSVGREPVGPVPRSGGRREGPDPERHHHRVGRRAATRLELVVDLLEHGRVALGDPGRDVVEALPTTTRSTARRRRPSRWPPPPWRRPTTYRPRRPARPRARLPRCARARRWPGRYTVASKPKSRGGAGDAGAEPAVGRGDDLEPTERGQRATELVHPVPLGRPAAEPAQRLAVERPAGAEHLVALETEAGRLVLDQQAPEPELVGQRSQLEQRCRRRVRAAGCGTSGRSSAGRPGARARAAGWPEHPDPCRDVSESDRRRRFRRRRRSRTGSPCRAR